MALTSVTNSNMLKLKPARALTLPVVKKRTRPSTKKPGLVKKAKIAPRLPARRKCAPNAKKNAAGLPNRTLTCPSCNTSHLLETLAMRVAAWHTLRNGPDVYCMRFRMGYERLRVVTEHTPVMTCGNCSGYPPETEFWRHLELNNDDEHVANLVSWFGVCSVPPAPAQCQ
jgi:hypothetical protein